MNNLLRISHYRFLLVLAMICIFVPLLPAKADAVAIRQPLQPAPVEQCVQSLLLLFQGKLTEAKPQLEAAVTALQQEKNPDNGVAMCAIFLGIVHHSTQDWVETLAAYDIALDVFRQNQDEQMIWATLFGISSAYSVQGRFDEAYAVLEEALTLTGMTQRSPAITACTDLSTRPRSDWTTTSLVQLARGATLNNLGVVIAAAQSQQQPFLHDYADAQDCFQAALDLFDDLRSQNANPEAMLNDMLSDTLLNLAFGGDISGDAFDTMFASLLINTMVPQLADAFTPVLISNLGQVVALEKEYVAAQRYFEEALVQIRAGQQQNDTAELELVLPLFTDLFGSIGLTADPQLDLLLQSLPELIKGGKRLNAIVGYNSEALVLNNLALVYMAQDQRELAQRTFAEALSIYEEKLAAYPGAINVHANLGWLAQQTEETAVALQHYEAAIDLLASVRSVAEGDVTQIRQGNGQMLDSIDLGGILSQQADVYALAANLYLKDDKPVEAFQAIERGRARLFRDMVSSGSPRLPDEEARLFGSLREAFDLQAQAAVSLTQLRAARPIDNTQIRQWEGEYTTAKTQVVALMAELEANYPHLLAFAPGVDPQIDLNALQTEILDDETTLIVYYIAEGLLETPIEQLAVAWVLDSDDITPVMLNTTGTEVRNLINGVRGSIAVQDFFFEGADTLYQNLFAPVRPHVKHNNLIIAPYGSLYYFPFAALWDVTTERYLIEDYTITYTPSVGSLALIQGNRNPNQGQLLALGNPDGTLPRTASEVKTIAEIYATLPLTGSLATESIVQEQSPAIDILHLAAHGNFDQFNPLGSAVALTEDKQNDGILEVREVFGLDLAETNLVFLSACETALGEQSLGDEITGLTRAFLYAGTPSIITTLWNVNDNASGALVSEFYHQLETQSSFAAALQAAQLATMRTEKWSDPYYWAAFTLHGDYLGVGERRETSINALAPVATPTPVQVTSTVTPTVQPTSLPSSEVQLEILVNDLNVRSGPGTAYPRIGVLSAGNRVTVVGSNSNESWWEVCCVDGQQGWVINNVNYMRVVEGTE